MDREFNELTPDAADLLDAYLKERPGATAEAVEIGKCFHLARQAARYPKPRPEELPALKLDRVSAVPNAPPLRWMGIAAMAACLMLGFWLGRSGQGPSSSTETPAIVQSHEEMSDFWSIRRLAARSGEASAPPRIRWTSPSAWPQIGDRS